MAKDLPHGCVTNPVLTQVLLRIPPAQCVTLMGNMWNYMNSRNFVMIHAPGPQTKFLYDFCSGVFVCSMPMCPMYPTACVVDGWSARTARQQLRMHVRGWQTLRATCKEQSRNGIVNCPNQVLKSQGTLRRLCGFGR